MRGWDPDAKYEWPVPGGEYMTEAERYNVGLWFYVLSNFTLEKEPFLTLEQRAELEAKKAKEDAEKAKEDAKKVKKDEIILPKFYESKKQKEKRLAREARTLKYARQALKLDPYRYGWRPIIAAIPDFEPEDYEGK